MQHKEGVSLIPANLELATLEMTLVITMSRETGLKTYLSKVKEKYEYILIDCMPILGMITLNALAAADSVNIPVQAQYLPAKGMAQFLQTVSKAQMRLNPNLKIDGILLTLIECRTNHAKSTAQTLTSNFGGVVKIYRSTILVAVKAAEVSSKGKSIYAYEPNSTVAKVYSDFTKEVMSDGHKKERLRTADAR